MRAWFTRGAALAALAVAPMAFSQQGDKPAARLVGKHQGVAQAVAFSPDGKTIASAGYQDKTMRLWDARTGKELRRFLAHTATGTGVAFAPDGKMVVSAGWNEAVRLWDPETGIESRSIEARDHAFAVAVSPDGKKVVTGGSDRTVRLWDFAEGKELLRMSGHAQRVWAVAFSPDGKAVASGSDDGTVRVWDAATGKQRHALEGHRNGFCPMAFSPDGRWLATGGADGVVHLWDVATGTERARFEHAQELLCLAFSPDGRTLAGGAHLDVSVRVWEVASGKTVVRLEHPLFVPGVAFSPDGRTLATACRDGGVRTWDVTGRIKDGKLRPAKLGDKELAGLWQALQGDDAEAAFRAGWTLAAGEAQAVRYLKGKLAPAKGDAAAAKRVAALIEQLDDDDFEVRRKGAVALEKLGGAAEEALRDAMKAGSLEVRRRAALLLQKVRGQMVPGPELPGVRAVAVLERVGGAEARAVLEKLSEGHAAAWQTREAKAALGRMPKR